MMPSKKSFLSLMAVAAILSALVMPAHAGAPAAGATIVNRRAAVDQSGQTFANGNADLGWKVWVTTQTNPMQLLDENSSAPTSGLIHEVCVSSGTAGEWAVVYDSATTGALTLTNYTSVVSYSAEVTAPVVRTTTQVNCHVYDAQFGYGAVVLQTGIGLGGTTHVYWRPSRGGAN